MTEALIETGTLVCGGCSSSDSIDALACLVAPPRTEAVVQD